MRKKVCGILGIALTVVGLMAGCSSEKKAQVDKLRVGFFPNITHSQALVGKAQGLFQKNFGETQVEWKAFNAGPAEMEAFFADELDIGYIGPGPAITAYTKSKGDIQIIAGATDAGAVLVTRKDLALTGVKELSGRRVAVPQFGNTQDLSLRFILQQNGLADVSKGGTVEIRQVDNPDIKTLLDRGEIDAALVPEPWGARLVNEVQARVLLDARSLWRDGKYTTAVIVAKRDFVKAHPELVETFLRTHVALTQYINEQPQEAKVAVNQEIKNSTGKSLPTAVLDSAFSNLIVTNDPEKESVLDFVDLSLQAGFIKSKPDLKNLFNLTIINQILKETGKAPIDE